MYFNDICRKKIALWTRKTAPAPTPIESECFHVISVVDGVTVSINSNQLEYSTDGTNFTAYTSGLNLTINNVGGMIYFRNASETPVTFSTQWNKVNFTFSGNVELAGDITTLCCKGGKVEEIGSYWFYCVFASKYVTSIDNVDFSSIKKVKSYGLYYTFRYSRISNCGDNFLKNVEELEQNALYSCFEGTLITKVGNFLPKLKTYVSNSLRQIFYDSSLKISTSHGTPIITPTSDQFRMFDNTLGEYKGNAFAGTTYYWYE